MEEIDIQALRADRSLDNSLWGRVWAAFFSIIYRKKEEEAARRFIVRTLRNHQSGHSLEGPCKLDIRDDEAPAVLAAKYRFLSSATS
ncbi:hypothetical protein XI07_04935 [Bradyrhizobium sp. CCBAU 11445]|uniref:hypothetical protein n=1 Tax=Bradyrhizobium sp. CCBAU 11445 TaxID=1630896 RepID=UPI00230688EB|nr:hypothetical protein [Bradyrhizobium sp. CCBAU 11445]MDA9481371.1 hypothetical protein [Bradyrhizobium sp. CCBAU 11445]